jgi:hypothetical protein
MVMYVICVCLSVYNGICIYNSAFIDLKIPYCITCLCTRFFLSNWTMYVDFSLPSNCFVVFLEIQCVRKVAVHLQKLLKVMSTSVYTGLNPFNFIRKHFLQICFRKVAVHLQKLLEVMSTSVYTGLNPFNFMQ